MAIPKKEYWHCIIGSTTRSKLPDGADGPLRQAVRNTYIKMIGKDNDNCWSGWGLSKEHVDLILRIDNIEKEDLPKVHAFIDSLTKT